MTFGPKHSSGHGGKGRRRRGRRGPGGGRPGGHQGGKGQQKQHNNPGGIFTHPMDHSYRAALQGGNAQRGTGTQYLQPDPEPLPQQHENAAPRIFAFIDDLFFLAKIQETSRKLNVKVEFVKTEKDILERMEQNGNGKPSLIIFDLNNLGAKPLATIPRLKKELKKGTTIIGFLSHVQGDLKVKAMEAGCDMVIPRSAFSQNLPSLLRRHGAPDELDVQ
jgi:CheY-like chemotaxis protein